MIIYFLFFGITIFQIYIFQNSKSCVKRLAINKSYYILAFVMVFSPLILLYGLRVDVGSDYFSYVRIYGEIKEVKLLNYIQRYIEKKEINEIAYYLINRIAYLLYDNEHTMFILTGIVMFGILFAAILKYKDISYPYAIFIFLTTQFAYATNGVRFALAYCVILYGFNYIVENNIKKYLACVLIAALFHKTAICCILFWLLKDFKSAKISQIRDYLLYLGVIMTPVCTRWAMQIAVKLPMFKTYASKYGVNWNNGKLVFLWRCLPAIVAIRILVKLYNIDLGKYKVLMNIELCRIPLLYLGYYYTFAGRLDRFAWVSEIILFPYIIHKIRNPKERILVYGGFAVWYLFIFIMYYVIQGGSEIIPYQSIFT